MKLQLKFFLIPICAYLIIGIPVTLIVYPDVRNWLIEAMKDSFPWIVAFLSIGAWIWLDSIMFRTK